MGYGTFKMGSEEYKKLELVAGLLEFSSPNNAKYVVEDVYLDYGQGWMWTTICRKGYRECQVLNPRDWDNIIFNSTTIEDLVACVKEIRNDKYFGDK